MMGILKHFQQYFSYILVVKPHWWRKQGASTQRKPLAFY